MPGFLSLRPSWPRTRDETIASRRTYTTYCAPPSCIVILQLNKAKDYTVCTTPEYIGMSDPVRTVSVCVYTLEKEIFSVYICICRIIAHTGCVLRNGGREGDNRATEAWAIGVQCPFFGYEK